jgi:hypothetical protein
MNLYKIQEELKFKSIPELQHFANGMDPKVPAWMASAVLKAKVDEKERFANMQGAAKGQMPSVKEQLEQKAGLMQQQAAQTPMGLAQPMAQPPQGPVQMPGGLTSGTAGSGMQFAEGGIVGFSGKDDSYVKDKYETPYDRERRLANEEGTGGLGNALLYASTPVAAAADVASLPVSLIRNMFYSGKGDAPGWTPFSDMRTRALQGDRVTNAVERNAATTEDRSPTEEDVKAAMQAKPNGTGRPYVGMLGNSQQGLGNATLASGPGKLVGGMTLDQAIAAARERNAQSNIPFTAEDEAVLRRRFAGAEADPTKKGPPAGPRPPAAATAGGLGSSSVAAMLQKQLAKEPAQPTTEDAINAIKGIQKGFGVDQPAGGEERAMIEEMKRRYAQGQENRGMRDLRGVMSAFGRGYGAAGSEANRAEEAATAADMAQQQKVYEMINGINKANRAEGVGASKSAGELLAGREKTAGEEGRARLQALAQTYHTDVAAAAQMEASRIMAAARTGQMDERQQLAELKALQSGLQAQLKGMNQFDKAGRAPYEQQLQIINAEIAKMAGVSTIPGAPGAANAGGTPPPGAVREVKR